MQVVVNVIGSFRTTDGCFIQVVSRTGSIIVVYLVYFTYKPLLPMLHVACSIFHIPTSQAWE